MADSVELIAESSEEDMKARTAEEIRKVLADLGGDTCEAIVIFAVTKDKMKSRWVGAPYTVWHLAHQGMDRLTESFALDAAAPLPGTKLN